MVVRSQPKGMHTYAIQAGMGFMPRENKGMLQRVERRPAAKAPVGRVIRIRSLRNSQLKGTHRLRSPVPWLVTTRRLRASQRRTPQLGELGQTTRHQTKPPTETVL